MSKVEKIKRELRVSFTDAIQNDYDYHPSLWLHKNGKKVVSILSRETNDNRSDKDMAFNEMMSSIIAVDPDEAVFCADAYFDMQAIVDDEDISQNEISKRFGNIENTRISAMITVIGLKNHPTSVFINPYFKSLDNRIWWLNGDSFPFDYFNSTKGIFSEKDTSNSMTTMVNPIQDSMDRMMSTVGMFPFGEANLFDMLSDMGHTIYVSDNYYVDR